MRMYANNAATGKGGKAVRERLETPAKTADATREPYANYLA